MSYFTPSGDPALFACQCGKGCEAPSPSPDLLARLDVLRFRLGRAVKVTSGPRCPYWNKKKGGTETSDHLTGEGADLECATSGERDRMLEELYQRPRLFKRVGIGKNFIHVGLSTKNPGDLTWTYY
jgi:zinc D-Ala-D-Ala carboxypeptidase